MNNLGMGNAFCRDSSDRKKRMVPSGQSLDAFEDEKDFEATAQCRFDRLSAAESLASRSVSSQDRQKSRDFVMCLRLGKMKYFSCGLGHAKLNASACRIGRQIELEKDYKV
ncbi:hypothetical protein [Roseibium sediminicola]|uniref:Uncharacterized protein n=1 Tax=Roseibium sediminicola TaxID=2933272 RepID=A0ABT0GUT2_9HYPH|nr:hypothetical protein [Roseibium sp. CAU 1639]MCK7613005.1 hypothetical protein [Roseibium sp. CAU 1639]